MTPPLSARRTPGVFVAGDVAVGAVEQQEYLGGVIPPHTVRRAG